MGFNVKKGLCLLFGGMMLTASLAGCGKNRPEKGAGSGGKQAADSQDKEKAGEREALTIASFNNLIKEEFITAFHEVYPEVELQIVSYAGSNGSGYAMHSLEHGDIPDIYVSSQNFSKESQEKYLLDLSNYDFVNNYSNTLLDAQDINGGIYLLPSGYQLTGIYYNKTILEENGWEVPQSFEELAMLSEKIEAAGYQTMGHGMSLDGFPFNYFFNIGNTMYFGTPEGTEWKEEFPEGRATAVGNSALQETAQYFNKWVEHGFITTQHTETSQFYEGDCVFFLCLGLTEYEYTASDGKLYEFGTIPWLSEDGSSNMLTRTVSRYMGINKNLADKGNEQKLEDALKLMDYVSTPEGQRTLLSSGSQYMSSLNGDTISEDSPYREIADLVKEGRTVPLLYVGWEDRIIPIAQDIKCLISGEIGVDELLEAFDETNDKLLGGSSDDVFAVAAQTLTLEETAKLVAIAEGKAVGADCAMISLNEYHGNDLSNNQGLAWFLYDGEINTEVVNMIRPKAAAISTLEMTGADIKAMQGDGFDLDGNGQPYEYLLFTKGDMELEDSAVYKVAISTGELTQERLADAVETEVSPLEAIVDYLRELENVSADVIDWK